MESRQMNARGCLLTLNTYGCLKEKAVLVWEENKMEKIEADEEAEDETNGETGWERTTGTKGWVNKIQRHRYRELMCGPLAAVDTECERNNFVYR